MSRPSPALLLGSALVLAACGAPAVDTPVPCPTAAPTAVPTAKTTTIGKSPAKAVSATPTAKPKTSSATPKASASPKSSAASPAPSAKPTAAAPDALTELQAVQAAMVDLSSYQAQVKGFDGRIDGSQTAKTEVTIRYRAPGDYRFEVQTSTLPMASGSKVVYHSGDKTLQAKAGGVLGLATLTLGLTDSMVLSLNRWTYDKMLFHAIVARALRNPLPPALAGTAKVGTTPVTVVQFDGDSELDAAVTKELIGFDADHHLRLWTCYTGDKGSTMIYQSYIESLQANLSLSDSTFKL